MKPIKAKAEWVKKFAELDKIVEQVHALNEQRLEMRGQLWNEIERDIKVFGKSLQYNSKKKQIEEAGY